MSQSPMRIGTRAASGTLRPASAGSRPAVHHDACVSPSVRLWSALVAAHAALDRSLERGSSGCAVVGPDALGVLLPLAEAPQHRLRLRELADRAGLTPSGLTRRVDDLVAAGLVARVTCPQDRRGTYAELTPAGLEAVPAALAHHAAVLDEEVGKRLDPASIARLRALLERLSKAAEAPGRADGRGAR